MENIGSVGNPTFDLRATGVQADVQQILQRINQVFQGEVLQLMDGGSIVLGVGSHKIAAQSRIELQVGDKFLFQVQQEAGEVLFKILPDSQGSQQAPKTSFQVFQGLAGQDEPVAELVHQLAEVLVQIGQAGSGKTGSGGNPLETLSLDRQTLQFLQNLVQKEPESFSQPAQDLGSQFPAKLTANLANDIPPSSSAQNTLSSVLPLPVVAGQEAVIVPSLQTPATTPPQVVLPGSPDAAPLVPPVITVIEPSSQEPSVLPSQVVTKPVPENIAAAGDKPTNPATQPFPELKPSSAEEALNDRVFRSLLARPEIQRWTAAVASVLRQTVHEGAPSPEKIQKNFENEGQPIESKIRQTILESRGSLPEKVVLQDLKSALLGLERELKDSAESLREKAEPKLEKTLQDLLTKVRETREGFEAKQVQNAMRQDSGEALHFQVPFQEGGKLRSMDLYYQSKKQSQSDSKSTATSSHYLVFFLEMSQLGALRVDALVRERRMDVRVRLEKESSANWVRKQLPDLSAGLSRIGFQVGILECSADYRREEREQAPDFDLPVLRENHLLDLEG